MMRIAREGVPFIFAFLLLAAFPAGVAGVLAAPSWVVALLAAPGVLLAGFSTWFFRDPERLAPTDPSVVVAPADGRVVAVQASPDGPSMAIFLNIFDVHVNRSPVAGEVTNVRYTRGSFLAAYDERAGEANERNEILVKGPAGEVRVRQIAGMIARRIVCKVQPGDRLAAGQRFGLIRFGSRTDLRLPPGSAITSQVGDRVRGGATVVGRLPAAGVLVAAPDVAAETRA